MSLDHFHGCNVSAATVFSNETQNSVVSPKGVHLRDNAQSVGSNQSSIISEHTVRPWRKIFENSRKATFSFRRDAIADTADKAHDLIRWQ